MPRIMLVHAAAALFWSAAAGLALAQSPLPAGAAAPAAPALADGLSPAKARDAVSRLSDREVRELLLARLDAVAREAERTARRQGLGDFVASTASAIAGTVSDAVSALPRLLTVQGAAFAGFYGSRGADGTAEFLGLAALAVLGGLAAAWLAQRLAGRWRGRVARATGDGGLKETLKILALRLLLDASGLLAVALVSGLVADWLMNPADRPLGRTLLACLVVLPMAVAALSRFLISPRRPELRLVHTDDRTAAVLHRHLVLLALLVGGQYAILTFNAASGIDGEKFKLGFWLTVATLAYIALISWRVRDGLKLMLRGRDDDLSPLAARMAASYPYAMIVLSGLTWLLVEILVAQGQIHLIARGNHYLTLALLAAAPAADTAIRGLVPHLAPPMTGEGRLAEDAHRAALRSYVRIGRVAAGGVFVIVMARMWEIDFANLASAGLGAKAAAAIVEALVVIGAGFLVLELTTLWINRRLASERADVEVAPAEEPGGGEGGGVGGSRMSTVLPLVRWVSRSAIAVVTALIALGSLGIDIAPLLAGAGIAGLAIGFGAQKLVTDVVSGIFFLLDDAFRIGEYVEIDGTPGTVEKISIRSLRLRHHRGAIHTIPFGEIPKLTNYSRDWVIMKLRFTVPFDTDLKTVKNIFKKIGAELMEVPEFADDLIQPFKSQGALEVDDVGIVVRGKYMAKPGRQFMVRKEIYSRVQKEFDAAGIQFARREVRVRVNEDEPEGAPSGAREAAAAAAVPASP